MKQIKATTKEKGVFWLAIALLAGMFWFAINNADLHNEVGTEVKLVDGVEFDRLMSEGAFVIDVHIPEQEHIPGTDAFIPYNELGAHLNELPEDRDMPILVYCRSGSMSRQASEEIARLGYTRVYDLEGGINAYRESHVAVEIQPESQDLGTVIYGEVARTEFTLTNFTPAPLKITRVATSCGCTSAEVVDKELEPYGETQVEVAFDPAVHKDDTDLGDIVRTIYVDTDNPNFKQVSATITAEVIKK